MQATQSSQSKHTNKNPNKQKTTKKVDKINLFRNTELGQQASQDYDPSKNRKIWALWTLQSLEAFFRQWWNRREPKHTTSHSLTWRDGNWGAEVTWISKQCQCRKSCVESEWVSWACIRGPSSLWMNTYPCIAHG